MSNNCVARKIINNVSRSEIILHFLYCWNENIFIYMLDTSCLAHSTLASKDKRNIQVIQPFSVGGIFYLTRELFAAILRRGILHANLIKTLILNEENCWKTFRREKCWREVLLSNKEMWNEVKIDRRSGIDKICCASETLHESENVLKSSERSISATRKIFNKVLINHKSQFIDFLSPSLTT